MMRDLPEWIGKTDSEAPPKRVRLRVFEKHKGICPACTRKLRPGHWALDHITAIANGGANRESNLQPLCTTPCHSLKTKIDVAEKSHSYGRRLAHAGIKPRRGRPLPGSKASPFKKRMNGTVERR